jgi:reactive intermediate/imine deaminase
LRGISIHAIAKESKINIFTTNAPAPIGTYSQAIKFDKTVYISGQIPINPKTGELIQGDFKEQIRQVFNNLSEIAKASNHSINDCLKLTIFTTEPCSLSNRDKSSTQECRC